MITVIACLLTAAVTLFVSQYLPAWIGKLRVDVPMTVAKAEDLARAAVKAVEEEWISILHHNANHIASLKKEVSQMLTQTETDAIAAVKALMDGKLTAEAALATERAKSADLQSQLDAEKANHADLVTQLQGVLNPAPAA